ncbi:unnamed protein product [Arctogadus glacialis]
MGLQPCVERNYGHELKTPASSTLNTSSLHVTKRPSYGYTNPDGEGKQLEHLFRKPLLIGPTCPRWCGWETPNQLICVLKLFLGDPPLGCVLKSALQHHCGVYNFNLRDVLLQLRFRVCISISPELCVGSSLLVVVRLAV